MAALPIRIYGDPVLRRRATPVAEITPEIRELVRDMTDTMYDAPGIGLAAPQVGVSSRVLVIDTAFGEGSDDGPGEATAFINPVLSAPSGSTELIEEGCLSVPDIRADVARPVAIGVDYMTLDGETVHIDADDILARVIQHEYDHLDGILFVDRASLVRRRLLSKQLKELARSHKRGRI